MIQRWQHVLPLRQQHAGVTYGPGMGERGSPAPVRQQVGLSAEHSLCSRPAAPRPPQAKAARPRSSDKAAGVRHQAPATATSPSSEEAAQAGGAGQAVGSTRGSLADGLHIKLGIGNTSQPPGLGAVSLHPEMKHLTSNHLVQPGWFSWKENVSVCKEVVFLFVFFLCSHR